MTDAPQTIHQAIHAVKSALALHGIGKDRQNSDQKYKFRGVEDVLNALSELFVTHRINVVPRITSIRSVERTTSTGKPMPASFVDAQFDLVSVDDGSMVTFQACGEGADISDKGTLKAMSAAFKYAMTLGFVIPTQGVLDEGDATTPGSEREQPAQETRDRDRQQQSGPTPMERMAGWVDAQVMALAKFVAPADFDKLTALRDGEDYKKGRAAVEKHDRNLFVRLTDAERGAVDRCDDVPF